ncbi:hypothetical protein ACSRUE_24115 [Sorangium sp. KYC3313]|uniref:hypothetical protein n=1 Tax=Sorangium sp. KYC3313 TaxID=3449740 RepID=UPI003F8BC195
MKLSSRRRRRVLASSFVVTVAGGAAACAWCRAYLERHRPRILGDRPAWPVPG